MTQIISSHTLWEEELVFYMTSKGRAYSMDLVTHKCKRIGLWQYQIYLDIYYNA